MTVKEFFDSKEKLAINCTTEQEANILLESFGKAGYEWASGDLYSPADDLARWYKFNRNTCYCNDHTYDDSKRCICNDYKILSFDEIEWLPKSMIWESSITDKLANFTDKWHKREKLLVEIKIISQELKDASKDIIEYYEGKIKDIVAEMKDIGLELGISRGEEFLSARSPKDIVVRREWFN